MENPRYKWEVSVLLWIAFFLNQADRQVYNVVLPLIQTDLHLTDVQAGAVTTLFNLFYAVLVPFAGYAGDVFSKKWIVVSSILFWSIATMFTGLSNGLLMLIIMRSFATGGGESFFGPSCYSLLGAYHKETRSFAMSVHQVSYYMGVIATGFLAGYIGEKYGWRSAFYLFGALGVIHGVIMIFRLKDKGGNMEYQEKVRFTEAFKILFKIPTALIVTIVLSGQVFVLAGYLTWMPTYLYEKFNMNLSMAGFHSMFYTHFFAFIGIILAGKYSDKLAVKKPELRLVVQGIGLLTAVPFIILMANSNTLIPVYFGLAGFGFGRGIYDSNIFAVLYDVIPKKYYSSATGVMLMFAFGFGSLAPIILGWMKPAFGLSLGISLFALIWLVCGLLMLIGYKFYFIKDYIRDNN